MAKKIITDKKLLKKSVRARQVISIPIDLINQFMVYPLYDGPEIIKIEENDFFLGLSKPEKIHSLPLRYAENNNVLSHVREKEKNAGIFSIHKDSYEKGLLYRLDFETSGLIMLAKNEDFYQKFRHELKKEKFYLAVVEGEAKNDFSYAHYIDYSGKKGAVGQVSTKANANSHLEGKKIIYHSKKNLSLVLIKLNEGKRHQIRIQLSHEGFPIYGDPIYGKTEASRMYLHSFSYQFYYNGNYYKIMDDNLKDLEIIFNADRVLEMAHQALLSFEGSHFR